MCEYCDIIQGEKHAATIYEDDSVIAFLHPSPATIGHVVVTPKEHAPIFEALDDEVSAHMFAIVNKISTAVFDAIKCEGTNITINNGIEAGQEIPHLSVNIIARKENDGLFPEWKPSNISEDQMTSIANVLKTEIRDKKSEITNEVQSAPEKEKTKFTPEKDEAIKKEKESKNKTKKQEEEEEKNYLLRQLRRMP